VSGFDTVIHAPNRLRICAALDPMEEGEFSWLRDVIGVSDSVLSKHLSVLIDAGYVTARRAVRDTRQRVWLQLTREGRAAYRGHVRALQEIVGLRPSRRPTTRSNRYGVEIVGSWGLDTS